MSPAPTPSDVSDSTQDGAPTIVSHGAQAQTTLAYRRPHPTGAALERRPLGFAPGRVLFLASFSQHLDTALLLERFDFEAEVIPLCDNNPSGDGPFGTLSIYWPQFALQSQAILERLRSALAAAPAIIVAGPRPLLAEYPADIRHRLRHLLETGSSFIHVNSDEDTAAVIFDGDTVPDGIRIQTIRNGADARRGYLDGDADLEADFDRAMRQVARDLVTHRAAYTRVIRCLQSHGSGIDIQCSPAADHELHLTVFRQADYTRVAHIALAAVADSAIELSGFIDDSYYVVAEIVDDAGRLHDWATLNIQLGLPDATAVQLDRTTVSPGDSIAVTYGGDHPSHVRVIWTDTLGRVLADGDSQLGEPLQAPPHSLTVLNRLELQLTYPDGRRRISTTDILIPSNSRKLDRGFRFFVWNICDRFSWRDQSYFDALRHSAYVDGICNCTTGRQAALQAARSGMSTIPYSAWFHKIGLDDCLFNDEWLASTRQRVLDATTNHRDFGAAGYTLGDECYIDAFTKGGRFSASETVWREFRDYLRALYTSLDELNAQWETAFASWDTVSMASDSSLLASLQNPSAWTDFRMFTAHIFAKRFRELRDVIRREDPGAYVGWDGCEQYSSYDGIDWWDFTKDMDIHVVYAGSTLGCTAGYGNRTFNSQAVKSFHSDAPVRGAFLNQINADCGPEYSPWLLLFQGYNSMWWWHASYPQPEYGALNWDLSCTPVMRDLAATMKELRGGIAAMLGGATRLTSPIALHYSANNFHASTIESGVGNHINNLGISKAEFWMADRIVGRTIGADAELTDMFGDVEPSGHYAPAFKNFLLLFKDMGFSPLTMSRQQIEDGSLAHDAPKVLVLPFTVSLSDEEAEAIRQFVADGGLLITDYHCGLRDLHGKVRSVPALDAVFGITHRQSSVVRQRATVDVEYSFSRGGRWNRVYRDDITINGSGCVLKAYDDGTPMPNDGTSVYGCHEDGSPAFIVNHYGRGKTLFLNFDLYDYSRLRQTGDSADTIDTFAFLLWSLAGLRADRIPRDRTGAPAPATETNHFTDGPVTYHGILPDFAVNDTRPVEGYMDFPASATVYDVRRQTRLGSGRQRLTLTPGTPILLAELPTDIVGISVSSLPIDSHKPIWGLHLQTETVSRVDLALTTRVEFITPTGDIIDHYTQIINVENMGSSITWTPSLNDPRGKWEIRATDVISGKTGSTFIVLECENGRIN